MMDFEELYINYFYRMKCFACEYISSEADAENIIQDIFMELWENQENIKNSINIVSFLFTSVRNRCIDHLRHQIIVRKSKTYMQNEYELIMQSKLNSLEVFDTSIFQEESLEEKITEIIESLPEKCREIFIKSKFEKKKQKEIADELNISIKTVENQMSIAYKKIKKEWPSYFLILVFFI